MYFTDRGIEELERRRGDEEVTLAWLADRLQERLIELGADRMTVRETGEPVAWPGDALRAIQDRP